jgi:hypothetical protein
MVDYRSIVTLAVKLLGLWMIVQGVMALAQVLPTLVRSPLVTELRLTYAIGMLVPFALGGLLWLFPARLANTIVHPGVPPDGAGPDWAVTLERVGMSLLGIFLLFQALSHLANHVVLYRAQRAVDPQAVHLFYPVFAATTVQVAFALLLVLRSEGIVNGLARLRAAGARRLPAGPR